MNVKQLKEKIQHLPDDTKVFMERVEDVYFDKHGWETQRVIFQGPIENPYEYTDCFEAEGTAYDGKLIILGHY